MKLRNMTPTKYHINSRIRRDYKSSLPVKLGRKRNYSSKRSNPVTPNITTRQTMPSLLEYISSERKEISHSSILKNYNDRNRIVHTTILGRFNERSEIRELSITFIHENKKYSEQVQVREKNLALSNKKMKLERKKLQNDKLRFNSYYFSRNFNKHNSFIKTQSRDIEQNDNEEDNKKMLFFTNPPKYRVRKNTEKFDRKERKIWNN